MVIIMMMMIMMVSIIVRIKTPTKKFNGYMESDIIMVKDRSGSERKNPLRHIGYSFRLAARVLLYAPSHTQDSTYHRFCCTSCGELAGTINSSVCALKIKMPMRTRR